LTFYWDAYFLASRRGRIQRFYEPTQADRAAAEFFRHLVGNEPSVPNDDAQVLTASAMPDAFDVVTDQAQADLLRRYRVLAYVGEHPARLRRRLRGCGGRVIFLDEPEAAASVLTEATLGLLPVRVEGPVHWLVNDKGRGLQIGIFNPRGVTVDFVRGERADPRAAVEATVWVGTDGRRAGGVRLDRARVSAAWPAGSGIRRRTAGRLDLAVGPGGLVVLEV
jgi:hypothetical protein